MNELDAREALVIICIAFFIACIIGGGIYAGIHATNVTNARLLRVQMSCIQAGNQWVQGNCLIHK